MDTPPSWLAMVSPCTPPETQLLARPRLTLPAGLWTSPSFVPLRPPAPGSQHPLFPTFFPLLPCPCPHQLAFLRPMSLDHQVAKMLSNNFHPSHSWLVLSMPSSQNCRPFCLSVPCSAFGLLPLSLLLSLQPHGRPSDAGVPRPEAGSSAQPIPSLQGVMVPKY